MKRIIGILVLCLLMIFPLAGAYAEKFSIRAETDDELGHFEFSLWSGGNKGQGRITFENEVVKLRAKLKQIYRQGDYLYYEARVTYKDLWNEKTYRYTEALTIEYDGGEYLYSTDLFPFSPMKVKRLR